MAIGAIPTESECQFAAQPSSRPAAKRQAATTLDISFSYVIPAGEAGAGATVEIQLLNEYLAHARQGDDPSVQEWRRCQPGVS